MEPDNCPEGSHCDDQAGEQVCIPDGGDPCGADDDCPQPLVCDRDNGVCVTCVREGDCDADELCIENECEKACPPDGCGPGFTCNRETRECELGNCTEAPAGSCGARNVCCPATGECVQGNCPGRICCGGVDGCREGSDRSCQERFALNYYCGEDNTCQILGCEGDGDCPLDSWCDLRSNPPNCKRGCRIGRCEDSEFCCEDPEVCDPVTHQCGARPCPNGQVDCTVEDSMLFCNADSGLCEEGCGDDTFCNTDEYEQCNMVTHECERLLCPGGDGDCPRAEWPEGMYCDGTLDPATCQPGCQAAADCPEGEPCANHACGCQVDEDCPQNSVCDAPICRELCQGFADCPGGWCDPEGSCQEGCPGDVLEPNDQRERSAAVPIEGATWQGLTLCAGEEDWYRLPVRPGDGFTATLTHVTDEAWIVLEVYHPDPGVGLVLAQSENGPGEGPATVSLAGAEVNQRGEYLLRVFSPQRQAHVAFHDLQITFQRGRPWCVADEFEGAERNDQVDRATQIGAGTFENLSLCADDEDWFRFRAGAGARASASITCVGQEQMRLELLDDQQQVLEFSENWCDNQVSLELPDGGAYFLRVSHSANHDQDDVLAYTLVLAVEGGGGPCDPDAFEPNDMRGAAAPLADIQIDPGTRTYNNLTICAGEVDWYEIPALCRVERLDARIDFVHADGDLDIELWDGDNRIDRSLGEEDSEVVTARNRPESPLYVMVYGPEGPTTTYDLTITLVCDSCVDDPFDAPPGNDDEEHAVAVELDQLYENLAACRADADWYRADFAAGDNIRVQLCFHQLECDMEVNVRAPDGTLMNEWCIGCPGHSSTDNECYLGENIAQAGQYTFEVSSFGGAGGACDYDFRVQTVEDGVICPRGRICP